LLIQIVNKKIKKKTADQKTNFLREAIAPESELLYG
jgi:hypothetical protein